MGLNYAHSRAIADLKASADIIVEAEAGTTYYGFCKPGTALETEEAWSILRVTETDPGTAGNVITFKWANGFCMFNLAFSDYETYTYKYKNF